VAPAGEQGVAVSSERYKLIPRVLCFVFSGAEVLLLKGAANKKIWAGKYNGLGGHVERDETVQAAAEREILEEAGLTVTDLRLRGVVNIDTGEAAGIGLFVFTAQAVGRTTTASVEGELEWVPVVRVGGLACVADVPVLLGRLATMEASAPPFSAHYRYDAAGKQVIRFG
jgi:8-oxo-dGTP diphosphatase